VENIKKVIGKRINSLLCERNMKQKEFAKCLGVTDNTVSYFVNGSRMPNMEQLVKIADFFNVSVDYIIGRTDVSSTDIEIKKICDYTKLSEMAIKNINNITNSENNRNDFDGSDMRVRVLDSFLSSEDLQYILSRISD